MTAAERFVKRMLGSISSSSYLNPNGASGSSSLPETQDLAKHDEQYHPDGYNPQTDDCSLRDGVKTKLTESVDADILEDKKAKPQETPTEKPPETRAEIMERVSKTHNEWSGGEAIQPWVEKLSDEDLKKYADLLDSVVNGEGETEPLLQFEEQKNNEYVEQNQGEEEQPKKPRNIAEIMRGAFTHMEGQKKQDEFKKREQEKQAKREAVPLYFFYPLSLFLFRPRSLDI